jgi:glycosyltransferase involved in cell wall biosynthesis
VKISGLPDSALTQIIGIVLVRNEDLFVRQAVENILDFCDRIFLVDNGSTDGTPGLLISLASRHSAKLSYHRISHPSESHELIKPYAGGENWIFGVDGDEIYDAERLAEFRPRLLAGEFSKHWMVLGNVLHCTELDAKRGKASGHLSPPSRSITKLYNFSAITAWDGDTVERLHGGNVHFRPGFGHDGKRNLERESDWDAAPLRCLHLCFLRRSSADSKKPAARENIMELHRGGLTGKLRRLLNRLLLRKNPSRWKQDRYCRGPLTTVETRSFFSE